MCISFVILHTHLYNSSAKNHNIVQPAYKLYKFLRFCEFWGKDIREMINIRIRNKKSRMLHSKILHISV